MKFQRLTLVSLFALAVLLVIVSSTAGGATGRKIKSAPGPINAIAMDGSRVVYDVGNPRGRGNRKPFGNKVLVWNVRTGKVTKVSGKRTNEADSTSTGSGVRELAIAGKRVAWIINLGGNTESSDYLCASSVAKQKEVKLAETIRSGPEEDPLGGWISGLVGSDKLLAVNRWTIDEHGAVTRAGLHLIGTRKLTRVATGPATLVAQSADAGRIAILRADGSVGVYSKAGRVLLTVTPSSAQELALQGGYLVVLTKARTLEVFDSHTGSLLKTLPVHGSVKGEPGSLDVERGIAVYTFSATNDLTLKPEVHVVNLATGADKVLAEIEARGRTVLAQIEQPGVVYTAPNYTFHGLTNAALVYVPFASVAAAVS